MTVQRVCEEVKQDDDVCRRNPLLKSRYDETGGGPWPSREHNGGRREARKWRLCFTQRMHVTRTHKGSDVKMTAG